MWIAASFLIAMPILKLSWPLKDGDPARAVLDGHRELGLVDAACPGGSALAGLASTLVSSIVPGFQ